MQTVPWQLVSAVLKEVAGDVDAVLVEAALAPDFDAITLSTARTGANQVACDHNETACEAFVLPVVACATLEHDRR